MISARTAALIAGAVACVFPVQTSPVDAQSAGRIMVAQTEAAADRDLVGNIQRLLAERGLDPGPADGFMGPRTQKAIAGYQEAAGLPADGLPSRSLYERLLAEAGTKPAGEDEPPASPELRNGTGDVAGPPAGEDAATSSPEAQQANVPQDSIDPPSDDPAPPPVPSLTGSAWRIVDAAGSAFTLTFAANGRVEGVLYGQFWTWRQSGNQVAVTYDNGMGQTVARSAILTGPAAMEGTAQPSRGVPWNWTAERVSVGDSAPESAD